MANKSHNMTFEQWMKSVDRHTVTWFGRKADSFNFDFAGSYDEADLPCDAAQYAMDECPRTSLT